MKFTLLVGAVLLSTYSLMAFEFPSVTNRPVILQLLNVWKQTAAPSQQIKLNQNDMIVGYAGADILTKRAHLVSSSFTA